MNTNTPTVCHLPHEGSVSIHRILVLDGVRPLDPPQASDKRIGEQTREVAWNRVRGRANVLLLQLGSAAGERVSDVLVQEEIDGGIHRTLDRLADAVQQSKYKDAVTGRRPIVDPVDHWKEPNHQEGNRKERKPQIDIENFAKGLVELSTKVPDHDAHHYHAIHEYHQNQHHKQRLHIEEGKAPSCANAFVFDPTPRACQTIAVCRQRHYHTHGSPRQDNDVVGNLQYSWAYFVEAASRTNDSGEEDVQGYYEDLHEHRDLEDLLKESLKVADSCVVL